MTKLRYFLISVVGVCVLILLLTISGLWQMGSKRIDNQLPDDEVADEVDSSRDLIKNKEGFEAYENADQMIFGLYLPSYDDLGQETSVVRSKHTALFENKIYKIKDPEIEFKNIAGNKDGLGPKKMIVSAEEGIMDIETSLGTLTGNVVIQFDNDVKIKTDSLSYSPDKNSVSTDDDVAIISEEMVISGNKLEVNLANAKGSIKNNVEMEFAEIDSESMFDIKTSKKEPVNESERQFNDDVFDDIDRDEKQPSSFVQGDGELVFDLSINTITFHDNVQAVVGDMNIFADQLRVILDSDKKKINKLIATKNVLAMSGSIIAKGGMLVWDAETGTATIEDKTKAEFLNDTILVSSKIIRLFQNQGWVEVPSAGRLITKSNMKLLDSTDSGAAQNKNMDEEDYYALDDIKGKAERQYYNKKYQTMQDRFINSDDPGQDSIDIAWQGRMLFKNNEHLATFEEGVKVVKPSSQMNSEELTVTFDEKNDIESIVANENVHIKEQRGNYKTEVDADTMTWGVDDKPMKLVGDPEAKIKLGNKQLSSSEIIIFNNGDRIVAKNRGNLRVNPELAENGNERTGYIYLEWQDNMVFNRKQGKASFYDRIEAFKDGLNIRCDVFDVFFDKEENVKKIVALENVYISSKILANLEGLGTMLTWDVDRNIAILSGNPVAELRKEGSRTLAKRVFFDINSRQVTWEGRTQWQMTNDGFGNVSKDEGKKENINNVGKDADKKNNMDNVGKDVDKKEGMNNVGKDADKKNNMDNVNEGDGKNDKKKNRKINKKINRRFK